MEYAHIELLRMKKLAVSDETKAADESNASKRFDENDGLKAVNTKNAFNAEEDISSHRFECRSCGYVYEPSDGLKKYDIPPGTSFLELDHKNFKCPVCREGAQSFRDIGLKSKPSGFEENLNYGFGVNNLTPGQKNVLIFGGLAFAVACFLSLYSLN